MNELSPFQWALRPLKHYAHFKGRSPRQEFWWWFLAQSLLLWLPMTIFFFVAIFSSIDASQGTGAPTPAPLMSFGIALVIFLVVILGLFLPNVAVQVRRMHDQNLSGWLVLLFFIPYIGGIVAIVFMCLPGTKGPNRFGRDPYEVENGYLERVFT